LGGISGQFYTQFALTIATSTVISTLVSLTLSPSLGVILLKEESGQKDWFTRVIDKLFGWFFRLFNRGFDASNRGYSWMVKRTLRMGVVMILLYAGILALALLGFKKVPPGFIPQQDQGYAIVAAQLPTGASLQRSDELARELIQIVNATPGVTSVVGFAGFNGATFSNASNAIVMFPVFDDFENRKSKELSGDAIIQNLRMATMGVQDAIAFVLPPPSVRGLGNGGGFKMEVQDRAGLGYATLEQSTWGLIMAAMQEPEIAQPFTPFTATAPQFYADIDREKALMLNVPLQNVFETLEIYLGSSFVNELNLYGRTFRVTAQADAEFRDDVDDVSSLKTRNLEGGMVPLGSLLEIQQRTGPDRVVRHNLFPAADLLGATHPGFSTGEAIHKMEEVAERTLPDGISYEWTELAFQEKKASGTASIYIFLLAIMFVFLLLTAQYESWGLPLAVILTVPLCLVGAIWGVWLRGMDNNILTQIGLVVLVGLARLRISTVFGSMMTVESLVFYFFGTWILVPSTAFR
ncbi:MAG: efflux RND transporter permease subunit, partial [Verrucomicrobiota bacterium]